jgi:hypothetical protein
MAIRPHFQATDVRERCPRQMLFQRTQARSPKSSVKIGGGYGTMTPRRCGQQAVDEGRKDV